MAVFDSLSLGEVMVNSIKFKLNLSFVVLITLLLGLSGGYSYFQQKTQLETQFNHQITASLNRLANSLPDPIWNYDTDLAANIIQSEMSAEGISSIISWSGDEIFYGSTKGDADNELLESFEKPEVFSSEISKELKIEEDGEAKSLGSVTIYTDSTHIDSAMNKQLMLTLAEIVVLDLVLVICLSWLLSSSVLSRLSQVTNAIKDIADGDGDLTCRIEDRRKDELGQLCDSFNAVIKKLQNGHARGLFRCKGADSNCAANFGDYRTDNEWGK